MYSPDENSDRWSGLYITALTGYTWGKVTEGTVTAGAPTDVTTTLINGIGSSLNGFNGSVKFGYNKQIDTNLIGIEFGGTWQNAVSKNELIDTLGLGVYGSDPASPTAETTLKTYETASVRAGHIFNNTMSIYMSGGVALGQIKRTINDSQCDWLCTTGGFVASDNKNAAFGYVLGAGSEYKLNKNWSVRGNFEYVKFNDVKTTVTSPNTYYMNQSNSIGLSNASVGLSYAF